LNYSTKVTKRAQVLLVLQHASAVTLMLMEVTPVDKMKVTNHKIGAGMRTRD